MKRIFLAALVGVLVSGPALAAKKGTLGHAIELYDKGGSSRSFILNFFAGLGEGVEWSNAILIKTGGKPHYCAPANVVMTPDRGFTIFRRYVEKANYFSLLSQQSGNIYINAMIYNFPCKK